MTVPPATAPPETAPPTLLPRAVVVTVSDRCHAGTQVDRSGPLAVELLRSAGFEVPAPVVVPDEVDAVRRAVREATTAGARLVLTTGGTGVGPRDVTPEAVDPLITLDLPGIAERIRARGAASTPLADLSRGRVGLLSRGPGAVLLVTAPGSTGGVRDTAAVLAPLAHHVLQQADGGGHHA